MQFIVYIFIRITLFFNIYFANSIIDIIIFMENDKTEGLP